MRKTSSQQKQYLPIKDRFEGIRTHSEEPQYRVKTEHCKVP